VHGIRAWWWDHHPVVAERPVIIVGCSRAGTTLVYKTFSESKTLGSLQRETHDLWASMHSLAERQWKSHEIVPQEADERDRRAISRYFFAHTGCRRFVDKNNQNGLSVPYLSTAYFPMHASCT
jgi:hypothetical protein